MPVVAATATGEAAVIVSGKARFAPSYYHGSGPCCRYYYWRDSRFDPTGRTWASDYCNYYTDRESAAVLAAPSGPFYLRLVSGGQRAATDNLTLVTRLFAPRCRACISGLRFGPALLTPLVTVHWSSLELYCSS